jgi:hypothetical protein
MFSSPHPLPDFDQAATDRRFLLELDRLLQQGAFVSYRQAAEKMGIRPSVLSEIQTGRYHCNLKLLYALVQQFPQADAYFIFFGAPAQPRTEPTTMPARQRGRRGPAA